MPRDTTPQFSEDKPQVVSPKNLAIPLWFASSLTCTFVAATAYFVTLLNTINSKLDSAANDRWKLSYQREWKYRLEKSNPTLNVPDPDEIVRKFNNQYP